MMELALAISVLTGTFLVAAAACRRGGVVRFRLISGSIVAIATFGIAATQLYRPPLEEADVLDRPIEVEPEGYVSSDRCQACHPGKYATWKASYHSSMTQVATRESVVGDFDNRSLRHGSETFFLSREGDEFWVEMPDIDGVDPRSGGRRVRRKIVLTTGSHHMQAYWYNAGNTRVLGLLPFVFDIELRRWYPRRASFVMPPLDEPESEVGRWNKVCLECHVTQGRLRPVEIAGVGGHDSQVAEFGIACESCHGPAESHVITHQNPLTRYSARADDRPQEQIVNPKRLSHERSTEVCGQCHSTSIWTTQDAIDDFMENGFRYRPGDRLADTKAIVRGKTEWNTPAVQAVLSFQKEFVPNTFWRDGMNRVSGREYNGLLETPCFERGEMSCLSCHQMHPSADDARPLAEWADDQLGLGMRSNLACTQCHGEFTEAVAAAAHAHHEPESNGSLCYNCHMPHTTYGLLKAIRSHQIDSPSIATSVETGRPNACNQCHLDRSLAWTAERLEQWYGLPSPPLSREMREVAAIPLMALQGDAGQRALAAWSLGWPPALAASGQNWQGLYLGVLLGDPYPAVRRVAYRSLRGQPGFADFEYDPMAPAAKLYESANAAVERWMRERTGDPSGRRPSILIDARGPRMDVVLQLLQDRDDRPVTFAE